MNKRNGNVARLPKDLRELVNRMLDDGAQYRSIINELEKHRHRWPDDIKEFNESNFTHWHNGGYQDWLKAQERIDERHYKCELAQQQAATGDPVFHDAGMNIIAQEFYDAFSRLNFEELTAKARENPDQLIRLLQIFIQFNRYCLQRDKFRNDLQQQQKAGDARNKPPREPVTPENLEMLCEKYGLK